MFFLGYIMVPYVAFISLRSVGIKVSTISVPSFFFIYYVLGAYAGILILYYGLDFHSILRGATDNKIIVKMFILSSGTLMMLTCGAVLASRSKLKRHTGNSRKFTTRPLNKFSILFLFLLVLISAIVIVDYVRSIGVVPILMAIGGQAGEAVNARVTLLTSNFQSTYSMGMYSLFARMILPLVSYILFAEYLQYHKNSIKLLLLFAVALSIVGSVIETAKGPLVFYALGLLITNLIVGGNRVYIKNIIVGLIIVLIITSIIMPLFMGSKLSIYETFIYMINRTMLGNLVPGYITIEMFDDGEFLLGASFPNPRGVLPYKQYLLAQEIWIKMMRPTYASNQLYTAPPVLWAELYANFGYFSFFLALFIGAFIAWLQIALNKIPFSSTKVGLSAWMTLYFMGISIKGVGAYMWDYYFFVVLLIAISIMLFQGRGKFYYSIGGNEAKIK